MASFRFIISLLNYTATATSVDANFPASNLSVLSPLARSYRAAVATGVVDVTFDFGVGNTLSGLAANPGILIDDLNVVSLRIQGNSSSSWGSPPWDQAITVAKHHGVGRYKDFRRLLDLGAAFAYRYLNIRILSQTPIDNLNYRIGRVCIGNISELSIAPTFEIEMLDEEAVRTTELFDGGCEFNIMGPPFMKMTYPRTFPGSVARDEHWDINRLGIGKPFVIWDASEGGTQDGWLMTRVEAAPLSKRFSLYRSVWPFRELI